MKIDIEKLKRELYEMDALRKKDDVQCDTAGRIEPQYFDGDLSELGLSPKVAEAMRKELGDKKLYQHQADAIRASMRGDNVVLESPTASGKTLSFTAPMLESVCGGGTALMVYPMKAVANDQMRQIDGISRHFNIRVKSLNGETSSEDKKAIKKDPPEILTISPEYLHASLLWHPDATEKFWRKLSFLVLDEAHEYRGYFGGHMSLIIRRLLAFLAKHEIPCPKIFVSTATCKDPENHANILTGQNFHCVRPKNLMQPKRHFVFVDHEIPPIGFLNILGARLVGVARTCLRQNLSALVFCPSVQFAERVFKWARNDAAQEGMNSGKIGVFHAGLESKLKREMQQGMQSGALDVIFCTNALELGIDVGRLDGVVLAGFPDSIASARQRIGRAGRSWDSDAFVLYYPMNNPIDQFFVKNLPVFLDNPLDAIFVDAENEECIKRHAPCLRKEQGIPINSAAEQFLGGALYQVAISQGEQVAYNPAYKWILDNMRGGEMGAKLIENGASIGTISGGRKFREAYRGAVIIHGGERYKVEESGDKFVSLVKEEQNVRTDPYIETRLPLGDSEPLDTREYRDGEIVVRTAFESINFGRRMLNFQLRRNSDDELLGSFDNANEEFSKNEYFNDHRALKISAIPLQKNIALKTLEQFMRVGSLFCADRHDIGTHCNEEKGEIYVYENYAGGIGVAHRIFEKWDDVLRQGIKIAKNCNCGKGCVNCIVPPRGKAREIDKRAGVALAEEILDAVASPETEQYRIQDGQWVKIENNAK